MNTRIAVIGVGGKGMRLGKFDVQKCLIPIEGKPIVEYVIEGLHACGIKLIILLSGFRHDQVAAYLSGFTLEGSTLALVYGGVEGENPAISRLEPFLNEEFIYLGGDCIFPSSAIQKLIAFAEDRPDDVAIVAVAPHIEMAPTHPFFMVAGERIEEVVLSTNPLAAPFTAMGMYYIRPKAFRFLKMVEPGKLGSGFLEKAIEAGEAASVCFIGTPWFCIHTPEDLERWDTSEMRKLLLES
ncbi:MAG: NDP-sugar synthase [Patescibacteria group bacterium]